MQTRIPPNTHSDFDWFAGLSREGLLVAAFAAMALLILHNEPWPASLRWPLMGLTALVGAALAWGRWPLDPTGDRLTVWLLRAVMYWTEERTVKRPCLPVSDSSPRGGDSPWSGVARVTRRPRRGRRSTPA